ncbi:MAG: UDP-glucose/GDP-mannose dehydrogenase family protein, partial [Planctomycetes bacterium]|nr:UDP-glucose/GDP-mannose dehydrogenase family protein [Planctomycetota bacterium]
MNITIIGTGYVGLVTGACLAEKGNKVHCVDVLEERIENLNKGIIPIYEPGLEELIKSDVKERSLWFTTDLKEAISDSTVLFICVGTPQNKDGSCDLKYVLQAADSIGGLLNELDDGRYRVIVDKSTVPVGTADKVVRAIKKHFDGDFDVVSNPEFLKEGAALDDFRKPDRIVLGSKSEKARDIMRELYAPFGRTKEKIIEMNVRSAELTKYAANCMLATRISFSNEMANLCEKVGAKYDDVRRGIGSDSRIGPKFLFAGIGYGGSCFPKDVKALINTAAEHEVDMSIIRAADRSNDEQKTVMMPKILRHFEDNIEGKYFGIWGLAFKPNTDDMREAPSIFMIRELRKRGAKIVAYDPESAQEAQKIFGDEIRYTESKY